MSQLEQYECVGGSGDVVIVVPSMNDLPQAPVRPDLHSHHICIDAEPDMEPNSPKTITESSSEFNLFSRIWKKSVF